MWVGRARRESGRASESGNPSLANEGGGVKVGARQQGQREWGARGKGGGRDQGERRGGRGESGRAAGRAAPSRGIGEWRRGLWGERVGVRVLTEAGPIYTRIEWRVWGGGGHD